MKPAAILHYLIVDDEPIAQRILKGYADRIPFLKCVGQCQHPLQALQALREHPVDLIFLDLHMPEMMGFDFLKALQSPPQIIVTTAYDQHAVEGFALNVVDYLLKPITETRFLQAIQKLAQPLPAPAASNASGTASQKLLIKGDKTHHYVEVADMTYVEACGNYCLIHVGKQTILTPRKISELEAEWRSHGFLRIHKSYLVAQRHLQAVRSKSVTVNGSELPIGMAFKRQLFQDLGLE